MVFIVFHAIQDSFIEHSEQTCTSLNLYWIHIQFYFNGDQKISVCIRLYDSDDGNVWDMDLCMNEEADASCFFQFFTRHWSHLVFMCTDKCMCVSDFSSFKLKLMWQINLISKKNPRKFKPTKWHKKPTFICWGKISGEWKEAENGRRRPKTPTQINHHYCWKRILSFVLLLVCFPFKQSKHTTKQKENLPRPPFSLLLFLVFITLLDRSLVFPFVSFYSYLIMNVTLQQYNLLSVFTVYNRQHCVLHV